MVRWAGIRVLNNNLSGWLWTVVGGVYGAKRTLFHDGWLLMVIGGVYGAEITLFLDGCKWWQAGIRRLNNNLSGWLERVVGRGYRVKEVEDLAQKTSSLTIRGNAKKLPLNSACKTQHLPLPGSCEKALPSQASTAGKIIVRAQR
ncbi:hypothetical protein T4C_10576 [Trichinella pseudospiralis]|uniref:Uncharacterized protein n=1 Tax=Trichinella pseudospiralis TaxID=6337 RepID=A0A0V1JWG9_TRIPS|nr:hypothetical protein T4C_10576 [Trichinella pseudospiralis]